MVYYSSESNWSLSSSEKYATGSYSSGSLYTVKRKYSCCGSWSRGQRCMGCPSGN